MLHALLRILHTVVAVAAVNAFASASVTHLLILKRACNIVSLVRLRCHRHRCVYIASIVYINIPFKSYFGYFLYHISNEWYAWAFMCILKTMLLAKQNILHCICTHRSRCSFYLEGSNWVWTFMTHMHRFNVQFYRFKKKYMIFNVSVLICTISENYSHIILKKNDIWWNCFRICIFINETKAFSMHFLFKFSISVGCFTVFNVYAYSLNIAFFFTDDNTLRATIANKLIHFIMCIFIYLECFKHHTYYFYTLGEPE